MRRLKRLSDPNKPGEGRVGLKIKKSKVTITKAPTSHGANPGTRPGTEFVNIISETKDNDNDIQDYTER